MITGDKRETALAIARETGIDHVIAGVLPDGKVAALDELRQGGKQIAFVGDGITTRRRWPMPMSGSRSAPAPMSPSSRRMWC